MARAEVVQAPRGTTSHAGRRRVPAVGVQVLLVVLVLALAELPVAWHYLVTWPQDQWQVDVEVYREAARSIVWGRPIYEQLTEPPQLLPFTYPPFSAVVALPLAFIPFRAVGWLWTAMQVGATYWTVLLAFRPLLERTRGWRWLAAAVLTAPVLWLLPVSDGVRFGQVNAFVVLLCVADLTARHPRWRRGTLVGLATAIKLTPGVFVVHFAWSRQWSRLRATVVAAVVATLGAALLLPTDSLAFWGGALDDPARLGPNAGTSNQSIRGVLLRLGPDGTAGTAVWLACALVVAVVGFTVARRFADAGWRLGEVATMGVMAVTLSPVAWIHHFAWMVPVVAALVGDGRSRQRVVMGLVVAAWFECRLPWWGVSWIADRTGPVWVGRILQNAYLPGALLALGLLWWLSRSPARRRRAPAAA